MKLTPETQALMLAILYGEHTDAERVEWEALCAENPALRQELERLRATVVVINQAEKPDEEEEKFFAAQWEELRSVMKPDDGLVQVALPLPTSQSQPTKIFRLVSAPTYRWYWAAATILVAVGLSFSVYRWQERDLKTAQMQESEAVSPGTAPQIMQQAAPQPRKRQDAGAGAVSDEQAPRQAAERTQGQRSGRSENPSKSTPTQSADELGTIQTKQQVSPPPAKDEKNIESSPKGEVQSNIQDNQPVEKSREFFKESEQKKADAPSDKELIEKAQREVKKRLEEARDYAPKSAAPQGLDAMRLQSAPSGTASKSVPLLAPTSEKPASMRALSRTKLSSTNATIHADSVQKHDSSIQKK